MTNWGHVIDAIKAEIGEENTTFYTKEWWIVQNGLKQQIAMMFDNNINIDGDEKTAWLSFRKAFCNGNNVEEDIGCWILVRGHGHAWTLQILLCMSKNMRIGNSKSCKDDHKSFKGTIYEMGTWFCGAN
jgi:hypothetical protein